ncbi:MAG TPA: glucoamylase family protein [Hanamia sp.]|nr:glucoamylase family protein [Hanamia sp.]
MKNVNPQGTDEEMLDLLLRETFGYFLHEVNEHTGLIADTTQSNAPASIAAVGMGLSCYVTGVEHQLMTRKEAVKRTLKVLKFFLKSHQGPEPDATGYKGFYYHFLDMQTGKRALESELSTIDTAILFAGIFTAQNYFTGDNKDERAIREIADELYARIDWQWALNGKETITHGWKPESGFLKHSWDKGYSEAHLIYILLLGSPTFPIDPKGYKKWISTFNWEKHYDIEYIHAGPLFIHQMSQIWIDFKGISKANRKLGIDYFVNSCRATRIQQLYAVENPSEFAHYGRSCWGFTASDGPGYSRHTIKGKEINFYGYIARGIPLDPDDGTISPWAVVASLPFEPAIVLSTVRYAIETLDLKKNARYGFEASFNPTFPEKKRHPLGWISEWQFAINEGPVILMIENYNTGLIWNLMKKSPHIINGLRRAGFTGGWLNEA